MKEKYYDVIIVGGGPAGLSAALYTSRMNLSTLVIEKNIPGSQLFETEKIDNYLGSYSEDSTELAEKMVEDASKYGAEIISFTQVDSIKKEDDLFEVIASETYGDEKFTYYTKSILLATGTNHTHLPIERHDEFLANGISYCATCDGAFFVDKDTVVVGGGDSALESALLLSEYANSVTVLVRSQLRAKPHLIDLAISKDNIKFIYSEVKELIGDDTLEEILLSNGAKIKADGLFVCIGAKPDFSYITNEELSSFEIVENYLLPKNDKYSTKVADGIFVAGDLKNPKFRQVSIAVGEGAYAALEIYEYVRGQ